MTQTGRETRIRIEFELPGQHLEEEREHQCTTSRSRVPRISTEILGLSPRNADLTPSDLNKAWLCYGAVTITYKELIRTRNNMRSASRTLTHKLLPLLITVQWRSSRRGQIHTAIRDSVIVGHEI
jgi:hypothetical protein